MDPLVLAILVGIPLAWLVAFAVYAYIDAPAHGMNRRKWAAISFFVPLFGFFAYLFERDERDYDPEEDPYARGDAAFSIHESRRDEGPLEPASSRTGRAADRDDEKQRSGDEERQRSADYEG